MKKDKKEHFIRFLEKWLIIAVILFVVIQLTAISVINHFVPEDQRLSNEEQEEWNKDYIGHWYNGTFFISMTVSENFEDMDTYELMLRKKENNSVSKTCYILGSICFVIGSVLLVIAAIKERRKKLLVGYTPIIISLSGLFYLLYKVFEEIDLYIDVSYYRKYATGFLKTASYYPMIYNMILPMLLIILGLILRHIQKKELKQSTDSNDILIKIFIVIIFLVGGGFTTYRFFTRVIELLINSEARLPFYYFIFDLPKSLALSNYAYTELITIRFIKDLPIFISSFVSILLFIKIIYNYMDNKIITKDNKIRYRIIFILLLVSSIIFNFLGLFEVLLYNTEFQNQYKDATYTIAIRSLTEPLLYAFYIYLFKHYVESTHKKRTD